MPGDTADARGRRRLRGFVVHLAGYFVVAAVLVVVNLATAPENPWFVWPLVGWGGILAFHVAFVMGLFGTRRS
ncbi:MAG: 2TM domain-containing protein [Alphaproteobacteria bacterium]